MLNPFRIEPLDDSELDYLRRRYTRESKQFYLGMRWLVAIIVVMPLGIVLLHNLYAEDDLTPMQVWIYAQIILLFIFLLAFLAGYFRLLHPYVQDLKQKEKIIETVLITEKKFMPQNSTFHFYINSEPTYSIEVDQVTYALYEVNDHINIEYAKHTEIYLGYF